MNEAVPPGLTLEYFFWWIALASTLLHTICFFRFFPHKRRPRASLVLGNALVFVCLLIAVATVAETYFRFLYVETDSRSVTLPSRKWELLYVRRNSLFCRDREWTGDKPAGVYRMAFVGDSCTHGAGIERERDRFTNLIQAQFEALRPGRVEVMTVAWSGWDTGQQLEFAFGKILPQYQVDEVVLCYFPNDIERLLPVTENFNPIRHARCTWMNTDNSYLMDYLYHRVMVRLRPEVTHYFDWIAQGYADPVIWQQQVQRLGQMAAWCRDHGAAFRVALLPFVKTSGMRYRTEEIHARICAEFEGLGVPVVDLAPALAPYNPDEMIVNRHDHHPNERAHALYAEAIWTAFEADWQALTEQPSP